MFMSLDFYDNSTSDKKKREKTQWVDRQFRD